MRPTAQPPDSRAWLKLQLLSKIYRRALLSMRTLPLNHRALKELHLQGALYTIATTCGTEMIVMECVVLGRTHKWNLDSRGYLQPRLLMKFPTASFNAQCNSSCLPSVSYASNAIGPVAESAVVAIRAAVFPDWNSHSLLVLDAYRIIRLNLP